MKSMIKVNKDEIGLGHNIIMQINTQHHNQRGHTGKKKCLTS